MRQDIEFRTEDGVTLRGWLYQPNEGNGPFPLIVMTQGFFGTKEMVLDEYAEVFSKGGFAALVYDHRTLGSSDGEPRGDIAPYEQIHDYRHAITFSRSLPVVDRNRIGVWGTSYSGAHVVVVGAIDRRVKCVVAQAPNLSFENPRRMFAPFALQQMREAFDADREARFRGKPPQRVPLVPKDFGASLANREPTYLFFEQMVRTGRGDTWSNEVTLRSLELFLEYDPSPYLSQLGPTPLLMIVMRDDTSVPPDIALRAFNNCAIEPKSAVVLPGGHYEVYSGEGFKRSSQAALDWFRRWL